MASGNQWFWLSTGIFFHFFPAPYIFLVILPWVMDYLFSSVILL